MKITKNFSGLTSEMINSRAQRTNGHCLLRGTELNLRHRKGLNIMMGLACQLSKIEPTHSIRESWNSFYLMRYLIIFLFKFHECYPGACSVNYSYNLVGYPTFPQMKHLHFFMQLGNIFTLKRNSPSKIKRLSHKKSKLLWKLFNPINCLF